MLRSRVSWVATGRPSFLGHAEDQGGLGCNRNGNYRLWSIAGWVATGRPSILVHAEDQGGLGCNRNGNYIRSSCGVEWVTGLG